MLPKDRGRRFREHSDARDKRGQHGPTTMRVPRLFSSRRSGRRDSEDVRPGPDKPVRPVFYDPKARRWPLFKYFCLAAAVILLSLVGLLVAALFVQVSLPRLQLPLAHALVRVSAPLARNQVSRVRQADISLSKAKEALERYLGREKQAASGASGFPSTGRGSGAQTQVVSQPPAPAIGGSVTEPFRSTVIGFYVNWDAASFSSLKDNIGRLDELMPEWLHLSSGGGGFIRDDPYTEAQTLAYIAKHRPDLPVVPLVNNYSAKLNGWDSHTLAAMLRSAAARQRAIAWLLAYVTSNHFQGINIDFESIPKSSQPALIEFMKELYRTFHPRGLEVSQCVPLDDPSFDCRALAKSADFLVLMAYDQHYVGSQAGPIASQDWYLSALGRRFAQASPSKYVVGLGGYGYDWTGASPNAAQLTFAGVLGAAQQSRATVRLDRASLNPTFDYADPQGRLHHVWFLDAVTAWNEIAQVRPFEPRGYALWRLGSEDPSLWSVFDRRNTLQVDPTELLHTIPCGTGVELKGQGQVLGVTASSLTPGNRQTTYDPAQGAVVAESILTYPSEYVLTRWGGGQKGKIALTFDDGPNPPYTSQILSILKLYHVPATFFIIGSNGIQHPDLLRQIVAQGNEIGNHTFTHPDISIISSEQLSLELNATERLIESATGKRSLLFRPPYGEDTEPTTRAQLAPLVTASRMGYYTVGMDIDPNDWSRPGVDVIVKSVLTQAQAGTGNVVLLHDGGGDRSQTVAALPAIIKGLRARGFQLVTISSLLGVSQASVNPPAPSDTFVTATGAGFQLLSGLSGLLPSLFLVGLSLGIVWLSVLVVLAVIGWRRSRRVRFVLAYAPPVAVVVPAYNEETVIAATIGALLRSSYPEFEIVVIDDGSSDETAEKALAAAAGDPRVRVLRKVNGGKASALNYGIARTGAEIIVALDADTLFASDTVGLLVRHFADPRVGAVAGNAKVGNRDNLLTRWQALEYITSQNLDRRAFSALNCITVVPGSVGAWRRESVLAAGGFAGDTLAEDADLTLAILRLGERIDYDEDAVGFTEAPESVRAFAKQRSRWVFGTMQAFWKHRSALLRPRQGALGLLAMPQAIVFKILFPLIAPLMDLAALGSFGLLIWQHYQHPEDGWSGGLVRLLLYCGLFLVADHLSAAVALLLEGNEDWKLLLWLVLQRFFYRQLLSYVALKAVLRAVRGELVGWGKLVRKGTVADYLPAALGVGSGKQTEVRWPARVPAYDRPTRATGRKDASPE